MPLACLPACLPAFVSLFFSLFVCVRRFPFQRPSLPLAASQFVRLMLTWPGIGIAAPESAKKFFGIFSSSFGLCFTLRLVLHKNAKLRQFSLIFCSFCAQIRQRQKKSGTNENKSDR